MSDTRARLTEPSMADTVSDEEVRKIIAAHSVPVPETGCWLWERGLTNKGYAKIHRGPKGASRPILVHRLSFRAFNAPIPSGLFVCHKCDTRSCVNPDHLFLGTNADNMADMAAKGRSGSYIGMRSGRRLQPDQVRAIRLDDRSFREIARSFGITTDAVSKIRARKNWPNIT